MNESETLEASSEFPNFQSKFSKFSNMAEQLVVKFELDIVNKEENPLKGYMLLSMASGKYPIDMYLHQKRLQKGTEKFLVDFILSYNLHLGRSPLSLCLDSRPELRHSFHIAAPLLMKDSHKFRIFLKFATIYWIMDDCMRRSGAEYGCMPFLSAGFFLDLSKICRNILSGLYRTPDAVPYFELPLFHQCLLALFEVQRDIRNEIGSKLYEKYHVFLLEELLSWIESHKLETHNFSGRQNLGYYHGTFADFTRYLYGRGALMELIQLLCGVFLDENYREMRIFQMFRERGVFLHGMSIDILGGKWDSGRSIIRRNKRSKNEGNTLETSFQESLDVMNDAMMDFLRLGRDLQKEFPKASLSYEKIRKYVRNLQFFVDGSVRGLIEDWKANGKGRFQVLKFNT